MPYDRLLSPLKLRGGITLKNRVIMAPMNTNYANPDGSVSERYCRYFEARAKGGVGMIVIAPGYVDRRAKKRVGSLLLDDESFVPALRAFTERLHRHGTVVLQQLNHNGRLLASSGAFQTSGGVCIGPSAVAHRLTGAVPRVMTREDIAEVTELFARSARNAALAGYDGVEIHGAHGYLINQFLSCYSNRREDEYGGSLQNRMRFALEIAAAVREAIGPGRLLSFRLEAMEYNPGGVEPREAAVLARELEAAGVDLLNVTAGNTESPDTALKMFPPGSEPQGCYSAYAREIRAAVRIPVSIMGRIATPERAEEILRDGDADLVTIGRGLLCDPEFVSKCASGRREELRQCIGCLQGCYEQLAKEQPLTCIYHPGVGFEGEEPERASSPMDVWVIGGGPAGMEAARSAALFGHRVALFEEKQALGGQVELASTPPGKSEFREIIRYYACELRRLGVRVECGRRVLPEEIAAARPDAVMVAVGSGPLLLPLPGLDLPYVLTARAVLAGAPCGERAVVCGGGLVGLETALFLNGQGREVTVIEMADTAAADAGPLNRCRLLQEIEAAGIRVQTGTRLLGVREHRVLTERGPEEQALYADTVVLAIGARADTSFESRLRELGYGGELYAVGDCVRARRVLEAVAEGAAAARRLGSEDRR